MPQVVVVLTLIPSSNLLIKFDGNVDQKDVRGLDSIITPRTSF